MVPRRFVDRCGSLKDAISRDPTPTQDYTRIKIGDVGFIDKGRFHLLFSAGSPLGERRPGHDVPDTFEPLNVGIPEFGNPRRADCLRTPTIRHRGAALGIGITRCVPPLGLPSTFFSKNMLPRLLESNAGCSFNLTGNCGAALVTLYPTNPEDHPKHSVPEFEAYTERHYESWVEFSRHKHGRDDIHPFLVSGFDMTKNFAMVAYLRDGSLQRGSPFPLPMFDPVSASFRGKWHSNFVPYTTHGPKQYNPPHEQATRILPSQWGGTGSFASEHNQCVFIRYHIMRTSGWWSEFRKKRIQVGSAGPQDRGSGKNKEGAFPGPAGGSGAESRTSGDSSLGEQRGPATGGTDSVADVVVRDAQDVWSLPCPLFSDLIFVFRTRDMTFGISLRITYSR